MDQDPRRRTRIPIELTVHVRVKDEQVTISSRNLSLKGLLCAPDPRLTLGAQCRITLRLTPDVQINIRGTIIRSDRQEAAIDFLAMDEESFTHLKKIVEYNTEDADRIDQELLRPAFTQPPPLNK